MTDMNEHETTHNTLPRTWAFRFAYVCLSNEMKIFWFGILFGACVATALILVGGITNAEDWRKAFITFPILFVIALVSVEIVITRLLHRIAGSKSKPIRLKDLKNWPNLTFAERFQVNFSLIVVFIGCAAMGWILGSLCFIFWSK